jgi:hypothetical protein
MNTYEQHARFIELATGEATLPCDPPEALRLVREWVCDSGEGLPDWWDDDIAAHVLEHARSFSDFGIDILMGAA